MTNGIIKLSNGNIVKLTKTQRTTLKALAELGNASTAEVAEDMGISEGAARSRLRKLEELTLVYCERSEGTAFSGSRALVSLEWSADSDDDDVRLALGLAPAETDMTVLAEADTNDGHRTLTLSGGISVVVRAEFEAVVGSVVTVATDMDGDSHIVDVVSNPEPQAEEVAQTMATATPVVRVVARRKRRITITIADLVEAVSRVELPAEEAPALVLTPEEVVAAAEPDTRPELGAYPDCPLPVIEGAERSLTASERRAVLAWAETVCAMATERLGLPWTSCAIDIKMAPRFTRCMGKACGMSTSWLLPRGYVKLAASFLWLRADKAERLNTVIHELAHVLAPAKAGRRVKGHGVEWRNIHRAMGLEPSTCHSVSNLPASETFASLSELRPGMTLRFGKRDGEKTRAEVVSVGRKRVTVKTLEPRGRRRRRPAGSTWFLPLGMLLRD